MSDARRRESLSRDLAVPMLVVSVLGLLVTALLVWWQYQSLVDTADDAVDSVVTSDALEASDAIRELTGVMESVAGLFDAVGDVSEREFADFTRQTLANHPMLQAVQYSVVVPAEQRPEYERQLAAAGRGTSIQDPTPEGLQPAGDRPLYVPITYNQPVQGNTSVFGLDIIYREGNRQTIETARDSGTVQVGGNTRIVQGDGTLDAVQIYAPVYEVGATPTSTTERRETLRGIAGAVVIYDRIMSEVTAEPVDDIADLALLDPDLAGGAATVLWRSPGAAELTYEELSTWPSTATIALPDRNLLLVGRPTAAYWDSLGLWRVWAAAAAGLAITLLLLLVLWKWTEAHFQGQRADEADRASSRLQDMVETDPLTGLPNRAGLRHWAGDWENEPAQGPVALLYLDLDHFKEITSRWGHPAGDEFLQVMGQRLGALHDPPDTLIARVSGDEFVVGARHDPDDVDALAALCDQVNQLVAEPVQLGDCRLELSACIGIAVFPQDGSSLDALLGAADTAVRLAKQHGPGSVRRYTRALAAEIDSRRRLHDGLRAAVRVPDEQFVLQYQPQVDLETGRVVGIEALIRWHEHPGRLRAPAEFIPVAEETGLIERLGNWVVRAACCQVAEWADSESAVGRVSVNVAAQQLGSLAFADELASIAEECGIPVGALEVEVTESTVMSPQGRKQLQQVHARGVSIAIDDFGTGYSSLSRLSEFPAQRLKIDRSFVAGLLTAPESLEIVRAIAAIGQALELETIAEGVETEEQARMLVAEGIQVAQGFWFSAPVGPLELAELARRGFGSQVRELASSVGAVGGDGHRFSGLGRA